MKSIAYGPYAMAKLWSEVGPEKRINGLVV